MLPPSSSQWWIILTTTGKFEPAGIQIVRATSKPAAGGGQAVEGPYATKLEAQKAALTLTGPSGTPPPPSGTTVSDPLSGLSAIGDFFSRLTDKATWVRVGEVVAGGILLYAGIRALSQGSAVTTGVRSAVKSTAKPVKKVGKAGISVAVPEARFATRIAAKKIAPKTAARVAAHRRKVAKYGAKKPYGPPEPRPATQRVSHVYYHKAGKP